MASARGTTRVGVRTSVRTPVIEEIVPNSGWTEDSAGHYLLVDLPEFRKEEVKLQVNSHGHILVTGETQANERKRLRFQLKFPTPVDSDMDNIAGRFDSGILYVTVPKRTAQENKESETEKTGNGEVERAEENYSHALNAGDPIQHDSHALNADVERRDPLQHDSHTKQEVERNENEHIGELVPERVIKKWEQGSMLSSALEILRKNKGIVTTAIIAFSLGLWVSRKLDFSRAP